MQGTNLREILLQRIPAPAMQPGVPGTPGLAGKAQETAALTCLAGRLPGSGQDHSALPDPRPAPSHQGERIKRQKNQRGERSMVGNGLALKTCAMVEGACLQSVD